MQGNESTTAKLESLNCDEILVAFHVHTVCGCVAERLDDAIDLATRRSVSTKYAKKVRRRLLSSLDGPKPADPDPRAAAAAMEPPAPSTPPAAAGAVSGSVFGSATAGVYRDVEIQSESRRMPNGAAVPRDALLPAEVKPKAAAAQPVVNHGALLAALLPKAKPKASARVKTGEVAAMTAEHTPNGSFSSQTVRLSARPALGRGLTLRTPALQAG